MRSINFDSPQGVTHTHKHQRTAVFYSYSSIFPIISTILTFSLFFAFGIVWLRIPKYNDYFRIRDEIRLQLLVGVVFLPGYVAYLFLTVRQRPPPSLHRAPPLSSYSHKKRGRTTFFFYFLLFCTVHTHRRTKTTLTSFILW